MGEEKAGCVRCRDNEKIQSLREARLAREALGNDMP